MPKAGIQILGASTRLERLGYSCRSACYVLCSDACRSAASDRGELDPSDGPATAPLEPLDLSGVASIFGAGDHDAGDGEGGRDVEAAAPTQTTRSLEDAGPGGGVAKVKLPLIHI